MGNGRETEGRKLVIKYAPGFEPQWFSPMITSFIILSATPLQLHKRRCLTEQEILALSFLGFWAAAAERCFEMHDFILSLIVWHIFTVGCSNTKINECMMTSKKKNLESWKIGYFCCSVCKLLLDTVLAFFVRWVDLKAWCFDLFHTKLKFDFSTLSF